jgi:purine-binding chemotaxis protein CheW
MAGAGGAARRIEASCQAEQFHPCPESGVCPVQPAQGKRPAQRRSHPTNVLRGLPCPRFSSLQPPAPRRGEFLTFRLGAEEYGIDILRVQEIRSYEQPTRIANAPAFLKGVVNLRGVIVPIVDLRLKLGCDGRIQHFTVVIVLNVRGRVVGAVVDSVSDVLELSGDAIRPAPQLNASIDAGFITGIGSVADRMLILMDIEALMGSSDMGLIDSVMQ